MLILWEGLATVFALMPGLAALAHVYANGRLRRRPSIREYLSLVLFLQRAKGEAYRKTADAFTGSSLLAIPIGWCLALIVAVIGCDKAFVLAGYVVLVILLPLAYVLGWRQGPEGR